MLIFSPKAIITNISQTLFDWVKRNILYTEITALVQSFQPKNAVTKHRILDITVEQHP